MLAESIELFSATVHADYARYVLHEGFGKTWITIACESFYDMLRYLTVQEQPNEPK